MRGFVFCVCLFVTCGVGCFAAPNAMAQKTIGDILAEKETPKSQMKTRSFKKSEAEEEETTDVRHKKMSGDGKQEFTEIAEDPEASIPEKDPVPPEEDVWEKYKAIAAGTNNKPMARKSYAVGKEANREKRLKISDSEKEETPEEEGDDAKPEKEKGGLGSVLENYKKKQTNKNPIREKSLNQ